MTLYIDEFDKNQIGLVYFVFDFKVCDEFVFWGQKCGAWAPNLLNCHFIGPMNDVVKFHVEA